MKRLISILLAITIVLTSLATLTFSVSAENEKSSLQSFVDETKKLIYYEPEPTITTSSVDEDSSGEDFSSCRLIVKADKGIEKLNSVGMASGFKDYYIVQFKNEYDTESAFEYYSTLDYVTAVSADESFDAVEMDDETESETVEFDGTPTRLNSWGSETTGLYALKDYVINNNISLSKVTVGVIDTGVDLNHEFFEGRLERTYFNLGSSGDENNEMYTAEGTTNAIHGTMVTSVIVDSTPENVKVRNYKVLDEDGHMRGAPISLAFLQAIIDNVDIINCSFGLSIGPKKYDAIYELVMDSVKEAYDNNILVVTSAGNWPNIIYEPERSCPASSEYALTVAAKGQGTYPTVWSSRGKCVDVTAPGVDIPVATVNNEYTKSSGTSFSSPITASICAMVLAIHPDYNVTDIIDSVKESATPFDEIFSFSELYGTGIVDAIGAVGINRPNISANYESGKYEGEISVTISTSGNEKIYYSLDQTVPTPTTGTLYTEPINIYDDVFVVKAVAYNDDGIPSEIMSYLYRSVVLADESDFEIDENGIIISYTGDLQSLIIPSKINGIEVTDIDNSAFSDSDVIDLTLPDTIKILGGVNGDGWCESFKDNKSLMFIDGESVEEIEGQTFMNCKKLVFVNFPNVKILREEAFSNVQTIGRLILPKVTYVEDMCFMGASIPYIYLPELTSCGSLAFSWFSTHEAYFPKLREITEDILGGKNADACVFQCATIRRPLDLPEIEDLLGYAFIDGSTKNSNIAFRMEFSKLKKLSDLPEGYSTLVLPSTVKSMPTDLSSYYIDSYTIYGSAGTYIEKYAKENGFEFIEVTPETAVITDLPKYYKSYMGMLEADVVGFNREYQWYANTENSNVGGTPIAGATSKYFDPADYYAPYYYCVVTSKDGDFDAIEIKTSACENRTSKALADYSAVDSALNKVPADLSIYTKESRENLEKAINAVEYNLDSTKQEKVNGFAEDIENAINALTLITVKLDQNDVTLFCKDSIKLSAECESKVVWSSSDSSVATVNQNGVVTAVGRGAATITATAENGESASCSVKVNFTLWQWVVYFLKLIYSGLVNAIKR